MKDVVGEPVWRDGRVSGRIVAEVFLGLMFGDTDSS
jgi:hypothetical protein